MRRFHVFSLVIMVLLLISATACGSETPTPESVREAPTATTETTTTEPITATTETTTTETITETITETSTETSTASVESATPALEPFDLANFDDSTTVDNQWMPLTPGTRFVYEGTTVEDDGETVPHRVEINITDLTKVIGEVRSVVTWDLDYTDGELVEAELAFYAQDKAGNVWRMGEYPEEYDTGALIAAPTWIHGIADAHAGIHMKANPEVGTPSYSQGWGPAVDWTDRGQVDQMGQEVCVPVACYKDVLVIAETSATEQNAFQLKSYAPGVGNVKVGWRGEGEKTQEVLELIELTQLSSEALAEVRTKALALEKSAYENSKDVYALTAPAE